MSNLSDAQWKIVKDIEIRIKNDMKKQIYANPPIIKKPKEFNTMTDEDADYMNKRKKLFKRMLNGEKFIFGIESLRI
jgi:hypothetical protein